MFLCLTIYNYTSLLYITGTVLALNFVQINSRVLQYHFKIQIQAITVSFSRVLKCALSVLQCFFPTKLSIISLTDRGYENHQIKMVPLLC